MVMPSDPQALDEVIVISREETRTTTDGRLLTEARDRFLRTGAVVLRGFLAPSLLMSVQQRIRQGAFTRQEHLTTGVEEVLARK